jgi:hypothetical protein
MTRDELISQNALLLQQVEQLTKQLEQSTQQLSTDNLNWRPLVGKCWNAAAAAWSNEMLRQAGLLKTILDDQHLVGKEGPNRAPVEKWTAMHQERFESYITVLQHPEVAHAVCEARERKRNSSLGLPPTVSELAELITKPEAEVVNVESRPRQGEFEARIAQAQLNPKRAHQGQ